MGCPACSHVRYNRQAVAFHWVSVLLVAVAYFTIEMRGSHSNPHRQLWIGMHVWAGSMLWLLSLVRLGWRMKRGVPQSLSGQKVLTSLSKIVHVALYAFVLLQSLLGMLIFNLGGKPVTLVGLNLSFALTGPHLRLAHSVKEVHELLGNIFYGVIGIHAAAALWHHFVFRDDALRRMSFA